MKKLLLPALLLAGCACANAEQTLLFEEDFEWLQPYSEAAGVGRTVETDDINAVATALTSIKDESEKTLFDIIEAKGYKFIYDKDDKKRTYLQMNYLKFGKTGNHSGITLPAIADVADGSAATLTFDWCPMRQGSGKLDPVNLVVIVDGDTIATVTHDWENDHVLEWIPATVEIPAVSATSTIAIGQLEFGKGTANRWFLDNIKVYGEKAAAEEPEEPVEGGRVFFSDDFSWLAPWVEADGLGDPVGTDNVGAKVVYTHETDAEAGYTNGCSLVNNESIYSHMTNGVVGNLKPAGTTLSGWPTPGYLYRMYPNSAFYSVFAADGYLRIGGDGQTGGLRTPDFEVPEDAEDLWLDFDWCPVKNANGEYDGTVLRVEAKPGGVEVGEDITCDLANGEPYAWQHVQINLFDEGMAPSPTFNVIIQNSQNAGQLKGGNFAFFLDNIRISETPTTGVKGINVEDNSNAPVEYYNLQGVRVANPESGLYIRRQGNKATKVVIR